MFEMNDLTYVIEQVEDLEDFLILINETNIY
jgi:hypothetical protein